MSNKGMVQSLPTRQKIALANKKDRTDLLKKLSEYVLSLTPLDFPNLTRAAIHAGINEKALLAYELRSEENSEIRILLEFIRDLSKASLMEGGLKKTYDARMSSFLLTVNHNMKSDAPSLTQNNIFTGLTPELLAEVLKLSREKPAISKATK